MNVEECAELLGVKPQTIRKYCRDGTLPAIRDVRVKNAYEIHERDFMVFIEENIEPSSWRQINRRKKKKDLTNAPQRPLTIEEARKFLGLSYYTVRTYCQDGIIKGKKVGRRWMITHQAMREFLALNRRAGNPNWKKVR